ncbi:DUF4091 domain-containing protein [Carboxylicivirga mesophila]|uniref:DUF4091 domain-containing protein n=1 Tax=Carboxylicivirga mesophila TaxID=1166478 RepID=A0ABS5K7E6_9BACT|nr:DUF4091 domain-containing protein [Carboxylicivirga mesophila]MBS2210812.1 DUF4091 domain-containing protein [Carboxylicivirga mesophila]
MKIYIVFALAGLFLLTSCYNQRPDISYSTFSEIDDSTPKNQEEWLATGRGLHLSFGSKDVKYMKGKVPMLAVVKDKQIHAWKGETVSFQAVLWSSYDVKQVECIWEDLVSEEGQTIEKDIIQTRYVRYMLSDAGFVNDQSLASNQRDSTLLPDMLDSLPCIDMEAQSVRPIWFTIQVPREAKAGIYKTALKVYSKENPPQELRLNLQVIEKTLPSTDDWRFQTNMCINPAEIARWHKVPLWSEQHFNELQPYVELMKRAGQKSITAYLFDHHNDVNAPLVQWVKQSNGQVVADFTNFDKWITFLLDNGITSQIDCYAFEPNISNSITILDEVTGKRQLKELKVQDDGRLIKACYTNIINHLLKKQWFDKTVFVVNEGPTEEVTRLKQLLHEVNKDVKLELLAHEWTSGLLKDVYAANVPSQFSNLKEWFRIRHQKGLETSYHLDANSPFPNVFLHSPSAESAWFGWYAAAQGIDGIHIEAFNNWLPNPLINARQEFRSSGSNYLIYPDAKSSIRFERLIEGIQDFEKILLMRDELEGVDDETSRRKLELLNEVLSDFVIERIPRESASQMVREGQELLWELHNQ